MTKIRIVDYPAEFQLRGLAKRTDWAIRFGIFMLNCGRLEEANKVFGELVDECTAIVEADTRRIEDSDCVNCGRETEHLVQRLIDVHTGEDALYTCIQCGGTHSASGCCCDACMEAEVES